LVIIVSIATNARDIFKSGTYHDKASGQSNMTFSDTPPGACCQSEPESGAEENHKENHVNASSANQEEKVQSGACNEEHS
jgi:hypothetical protein